MTHPAELPPEELLRDCRIEMRRRGGPGGQHRNKVETAVLLTHEPSGVSAEANERRSQAQNRTVAVRRLRLRLALSVRGEREHAPGPSPRWLARCRDGRIVVSAEHEDYPALLAEALDRLAESAYDVGPAAERLGCTASQLLKLLRREPEAFLHLNAARERQGLPRLR